MARQKSRPGNIAQPYDGKEVVQRQGGKGRQDLPHGI
eukprot:CAMPEP_0119135072 /NCGR_PEP_ID=MMETSP1310-20130426/18601_1 /TAXON_ID=464262 /ORGANISM="Genus nov. species nov., Strain RCC2339" /LENGTH=36 /DNA_ID= /DNA_START= /DNA_END= /DNA_ORIENTATION=